MSSLAVLFAVASAVMGSSRSMAAPASLVGTWILERSENPMPDGTVVPYCSGVHGLIIYTVEGYVSVALNCDPIGDGPEPADVSGRKFLYAGTYSFDGNQVTHHLSNASQPELIGTSFTRSVSIEGDQLILSGENQGQKFSAYWTRVGAIAAG